MPSAAAVKIDKQVCPENALLDNSTPLRQGITIIEHKIRNLEKRKSKLESYKELQNAGKELNADQKTAVAKFNEVLQTLDFARDLCKQFLGIAAVTEKEAKKVAKKEAAAKNQAELARLREILLVQDALGQMGTDTVRDDFLQGRNGAAQLSENDLKLLDEIYPHVTPKHEAGNPTVFTNEVQAAAEHLLAVVDGKPKDAFGGSYSQIKEILGKIHESGYFDQGQAFENFAEGGAPVVEPQELLPIEHAPISNHEMLPMEPSNVHENIHDNRPSNIHPPLNQQQLNVEAIQQQQQQPQPLLESQQLMSPEQMYYQQPPVLPPQARPISEVLGTGSFFFLQDSEIDPQPQSDPQQPQQIPTQTFTNQSFVAVTGPPPPIALPPHFQQIPNNLPPNLAPPAGNVTNNGLNDEKSQQQDEIILKHKTIPVQSSGMNRQRVNNHQSNYYQNNNGYSNSNSGSRPRGQHQQQQQRNGARVAAGGNGNRH